MEMSFMKNIAHHILESDTESERVKSRCRILIERVDVTPLQVATCLVFLYLQNNQLLQNVDVDFVALLRELQLLYRSIGPAAIPFSDKNNLSEW
jgi:hypothetical protein